MANVARVNACVQLKQKHFISRASGWFHLYLLYLLQAILLTTVKVEERSQTNHKCLSDRQLEDPR